MREPPQLLDFTNITSSAGQPKPTMGDDEQQQDHLETVPCPKLDEIIARHRKSYETMASRLPDKGKKILHVLRRLEEEKERRKSCQCLKTIGDDEQQGDHLETVPCPKLDEIIAQRRKSYETMASRLPDKGQKILSALSRLEDEKERRKSCPVIKNEVCDLICASTKEAPFDLNVGLQASNRSGNGTENGDLPSADCGPSVADSLPSNSEAKEAQLNVDFSEKGNDRGDKHRQSSLASESVQRPRMIIDEQPPSIHVLYNYLPRDSKRKLEKLLQHWSEWHARHYPSSHDSNEVLESGEETYFPALHVGADKPSSVFFWMDNQTRNPQSNENIMLDSNSVPLYDRGYALALIPSDGSGNLERGMEVVDDSRCFNCGSYNHSLKECPKPRNSVAVSNARKLQKCRRNQNASSRNPTRYYQSSPGGKYDDLKPGVLNAETRQLLGLQELDPPPWLNRMRELGYPPGYLDSEDENRPSGITMYEEERKEEKEDGKIADTAYPELPKKGSVEFPGINAPIPENADESLWAVGHSSLDLSRNLSNRRFNHSSEPSSRYYPEQRFPRDFRDDEPPGIEQSTHPAASSYTSYSQRGNSSIPRSPSFQSPMSDMGRRSPLVQETPKYDLNSIPLENDDNDRPLDSSFQCKDKHEWHLPLR